MGTLDSLVPSFHTFKRKHPLEVTYHSTICNGVLFTADVMKSKGANTIIAVDVGSEYPAELTNYGDHLSGWWLLWKKWNPFSEKIYVSDECKLMVWYSMIYGMVYGVWYGVWYGMMYGCMVWCMV